NNLLCNSSFIALIPKVSNATLVTDFLPISLIGCQYKIIRKILANRLGMVIGSCISPKQYAFIKGRNILDGPLILNEVMNWHRKRKKKIMIFKVDFEKAFDSLRWDFLDTVIDKLGFGSRWQSWIKGCFVNARSSILANGSSTSQFDIYKGLKQGDSLSLFLFILAMEGLHAFICKADNIGIYIGASIEEDILDMANIIGCGAAKLPMKYLGVPVGCNMARHNNWEAIIQKISPKFSFWKAHLLSVGGRLSLIKSVLGKFPTYFMSLYLMPASIRSKLESMRNNFFIGGELVRKRWLGFVHNHSDLWVKVIEGIYGHNGDIFDEHLHRSNQSPWSGILSLDKSIKQKGIDLLSFCNQKLGNGGSTQFWNDIWCGHQALKNRFPRIYMLDNDKGCSVANRLPLLDRSSFLRRIPRGGVEDAQFSELRLFIDPVVLTSQKDSWLWSLDVSKGFTVGSVRSLIDSYTLECGRITTRWNRSTPIKVNIFL
nr:RNA-directed DNA polymerase, eukaryota, reverse transcriptase zinc-binding domain protein [Tanacetum cinerariifolium]